MSYDVTKINNVPMRVLFGTAGAEVELGYTAPGEITVTFAEEWVEQMAHQTGNRVIEAYAKPGNPTIQVGLMEISTLSNWAIAFPLGSAQSDGKGPDKPNIDLMKEIRTAVASPAAKKKRSK